MSIISRVVTEAVSYDLVDLATVKDEQGIPQTDTTNDGKLSRVISQVSAAIGNYCNRVFTVEEIEDRIWFSPHHRLYHRDVAAESGIVLSRYPVTRCSFQPLVAGVAVGANVLPIVDVSFIGEDDLTISAAALGIPDGTTIASGDATAQTVTLSAPVTAAIAEGTTIAFGFTVTEGVPNCTRTLYPETDYVLDQKTGLLRRACSWGFGGNGYWNGPLTIRYSAGYFDIPDDLQAAALRWIALRWQGQGRDPMLREWEQPGVGRKVYWIGGPPMSGGVPQEIASLLDSYRVPVVG